MRKKKDNKHLGLVIPPFMHYKLKYIAQYEGRTMSGHVLYLIRQNIKEFEAVEGRIELPSEEE